MAKLAIILAVIAMFISMLGLTMLVLDDVLTGRIARKVQRAVPYTMATGVAVMVLAVMSLLIEIIPKLLGAFNG